MSFDVNNKNTYPRRWVHLDFHTSPDIKGIGSRFSKEQFQAALKEGNVDSITCFAKCHHGLCYYPTKVGTMHPELDFDLLGAQIEAAHEIGVRAPIYITAGWSDGDVKNHPEWRSTRLDGTHFKGKLRDDALPTDYRPDNAWDYLCLNDGAYCRHIYEITEEVCKRYEKVDGLFFDICFMEPYCVCDECRQGMIERGLNPEDENDAHKYYVDRHIDFMKKCKAILDKYHKDATIFFNSGGADIDKPEYHPFETHYEMEDLPTCWGGYDKMPLKASFFSGTGKYFLGMTGKFHLNWGEFGGFKFGDALKYEVATMATFGAGCCIGDHLFPDGEMDMQTYKYIGEAYTYYEKIEPYCLEGKETSTIGIVLCENNFANMGLSKILNENQIDFNIVQNGNFARFDTVIIPGKVDMSKEDEEKLIAFVNGGGKLLFMGDALIKDGKFLVDCGLANPVEDNGNGDYINNISLEGNLPESPFYTYYPCVTADEVDAEIFARVKKPQFNRTYVRFCGHRNTPYFKEDKGYAGVAKKGNVVYISHPITLVYNDFGSIFHKRYMILALNLLNPKLALKTYFGSLGRCRMIDQPQNSRYCINVTYAAPARRGAAEIIEDILPIYDTPFTLTTDKKVVSVALPLQGKEIPFTQNGEVCTFTLDKFCCHETIVVNYK